MPGPLDILKSLMGTRGSSGGRAASQMRFPTISRGDIAQMKKYRTIVQQIGRDITTLSNRGNFKGAAVLSAQLRAVDPLQKAYRELLAVQGEWLSVMRSGTASVNDRVRAERRLAEATKQYREEEQKTNVILNEQRGIFGRLKNVSEDLRKHSGKVALAAAGVELVKISGEMNSAFDMLARSGGNLNGSFLDLATTTGKYAFESRKAAISSSLLGFSAEDSRKAFDSLNLAFGFSSEHAEVIADQFQNLASVAKASGLELGEAARFAEMNWRRFGKSFPDSIKELASVNLHVKDLTRIFGKGRIDVSEFETAVFQLSTATGNYNQNTKFLIESLKRELALQLSLGKSKEAAMAAAKQNLQGAGQTNIAGVHMFAQQLQKEFRQSEDKEAFLGNMEKEQRFGAQTGLISHMMKTGGLTEGLNLFALEELTKNSSELQGAILDMRRENALIGRAGLGLATGQTLGEEAVTQREGAMRRSHLIAARQALQAGRTPDATTLGVDLSKKTPETDKVREALLAGKSIDLVSAERAVKKAQSLEAVMEDPKADPTEKVISDMNKGFLDVVNAINGLKTFFGEAPFAKSIGAILGPMIGSYLGTAGMMAAGGGLGAAAGGLAGVAVTVASVVPLVLVALAGVGLGVLMNKLMPQKWKDVLTADTLINKMTEPGAEEMAKANDPRRSAIRRANPGISNKALEAKLAEMGGEEEHNKKFFAEQAKLKEQREISRIFEAGSAKRAQEASRPTTSVASTPARSPAAGAAAGNPTARAAGVNQSGQLHLIVENWGQIMADSQPVRQ